MGRRGHRHAIRLDFAFWLSSAYLDGFAVYGADYDHNRRTGGYCQRLRKTLD